MEVSGLHLLKVRVDTLESSFFGAKNAAQFDKVALFEKLSNIIEKLSVVDKEVPNLKLCWERIEKLYPLINEKKAVLCKTTNVAEELLSKKNDIQTYLNDLSCIDRLSNLYLDQVELQQRMISIDQLLQSVRIEVSKQTSDLDELLELYEKSMTVVSDACQRWNVKLQSLGV